MTGQLVHLAVWAGLSVMGAGPQAASRAPVSGGAHDAPWTRASREQRDQAMDLFKQANKALHESEMKKAVKLYRQALTHWDHPAFHYNLAIALLATSNALECHQHLEAATRYGPEPLNDPEKYRNALSIMSEVEGQLVRLELSCDEPRAKVTVDGRENLFSCPGSYGQWTQPGIHVIRVAKDGFFPTTKHLSVQPGERRVLPLRLYTEAQWTRTRSRWPVWMPWAVMGSGVAALGIGGGLHVFAGSQFQAYDDAVKACAGVPSNTLAFRPCELSPELERPLVVANVTQGVAWGFYAGGVAVLGTGAVLLSLNFPQPYLVDPENGIAPESVPAMAVTPMLAPGYRGIVLVGTF